MQHRSNLRPLREKRKKLRPSFIPSIIHIQYSLQPREIGFIDHSLEMRLSFKMYPRLAISYAKDMPSDSTQSSIHLRLQMIQPHCLSLDSALPLDSGVALGILLSLSVSQIPYLKNRITNSSYL